MESGYRDKTLPIEKRVESLLALMSLEEKVAQLKASRFTIGEALERLFEGVPAGARHKIEKEFLGPATWRMFIEARDNHAAIVRAGWKKHWKPLISDGDGIAVGELSQALQAFGPKEGAELANEIQEHVRKTTRLGIPVIIHDDTLHGGMAKGSACFPQSIGMAASWDPDLMKEVAVAIGRETRARGIHQSLSPTINVARDVRNGRTEETYGEDPFLAARFARAYVEGVQSQRVVATPKHFAVNFVGPGGRDSNEVPFSERHMREIYLPAFRAAVEGAGALSIMPAYNAIDGVPCHSDRWLLTDLLRNEWGFQGYVVSDYLAIDRQISHLGAAKDKAEAAKIALEAGVDMELPASDCFEEVLGMVRSGRLSEAVIDEAVRRILRVKFWLGLFEDPFCDPEEARRVVDCPEHRALALRAARRTMVLLSNNGVLPLSKEIRSVAVIGPNATRANIGEYSGFGMKVVTPLEGIRAVVSPRTEVFHAQGCAVNGPSKEGFEEALRIAALSDAVIACVGNSPETEGEGRDRTCLDLPGAQEDLILALAQLGKPLVVVLLSGGAVTMERWKDKVGAIVHAWYPGEEGGTALAEVLFGTCAPGGRLPITFPRTTGQLPLYYNPEASGRGWTYVDLRGEQAAFPFGHGLSYTEFAYANLRVTPPVLPVGGTAFVECDVTNVGGRPGDEVVQLYLHDEAASITRPIQELKGFARITLEPGQKETASFSLTTDDLSYWDRRGRRVAEPGMFRIMVGSSSGDIRLHGTIELRNL